MCSALSPDSPGSNLFMLRSLKQCAACIVKVSRAVSCLQHRTMDEQQ
jgi:hypothetical protein